MMNAGGVLVEFFYDYQRPDDKLDATAWMNFWKKACGDAFSNAYMPIVEKG